MSLSKQEFGSFYERKQLVFSESNWITDATFLGSGRDALFEVLRAITFIGEIDKSSLTVWIPSYYCHPITKTLSQEYNVRIYPSTPYLPIVMTELFESSDVIVVPEYFGKKSQINLQGTPVVLLDKTHNPSSNYRYDFQVDYEFASLRKILPIAEGGYVKCLTSFSPNKITQPPATDKHLETYHRVSSAMKSKALYLDGMGIEKKEFLQVYSECETELGDIKNPSGAVMPIDELCKLDISFYLDARHRNNRLLVNELNTLCSDLEIIDRDTFFIVGFQDNAVRESVKKKLIENHVYPAVLWPIDEQYMTEADKVFSERILVLPTDFRYDESQILRLSEIFIRVVEGLKVVN